MGVGASLQSANERTGSLAPGSDVQRPVARQLLPLLAPTNPCMSPTASIVPASCWLDVPPATVIRLSGNDHDGAAHDAATPTRNRSGLFQRASASLAKRLSLGKERSSSPTSLQQVQQAEEEAVSAVPLIEWVVNRWRRDAGEPPLRVHASGQSAFLECATASPVTARVTALAPDRADALDSPTPSRFATREFPGESTAPRSRGSTPTPSPRVGTHVRSDSPRSANTGSEAAVFADLPHLMHSAGCQAVPGGGFAVVAVDAFAASLEAARCPAFALACLHPAAKELRVSSVEAAASVLEATILAVREFRFFVAHSATERTARGPGGDLIDSSSRKALPTPAAFTRVMGRLRASSVSQSPTTLPLESRTGAVGPARGQQSGHHSPASPAPPRGRAGSPFIPLLRLVSADLPSNGPGAKHRDSMTALSPFRTRAHSLASAPASPTLLVGDSPTAELDRNLSFSEPARWFSVPADGATGVHLPPSDGQLHIIVVPFLTSARDPRKGAVSGVPLAISEVSQLTVENKYDTSSEGKTADHGGLPCDKQVLTFGSHGAPALVVSVPASSIRPRTLVCVTLKLELFDELSGETCTLQLAMSFRMRPPLRWCIPVPAPASLLARGGSGVEGGSEHAVWQHPAVCAALAAHRDLLEVAPFGMPRTYSSGQGPCAPWICPRSLDSVRDTKTGAPLLRHALHAAIERYVGDWSLNQWQVHMRPSRRSSDQLAQHGGSSTSGFAWDGDGRPEQIECDHAECTLEVGSVGVVDSNDASPTIAHELVHCVLARVRADLRHPGSSTMLVCCTSVTATGVPADTTLCVEMAVHAVSRHDLCTQGVASPTASGAARALGLLDNNFQVAKSKRATGAAPTTTLCLPFADVTAGACNTHLVIVPTVSIVRTGMLERVIEHPEARVHVECRVHVLSIPAVPPIARAPRSPLHLASLTLNRPPCVAACSGGWSISEVKYTVFCLTVLPKASAAAATAPVPTPPPSPSVVSSSNVALIAERSTPSPPPSGTGQVHLAIEFSNASINEPHCEVPPMRLYNKRDRAGVLHSCLACTSRGMPTGLMLRCSLTPRSSPFWICPTFPDWFTAAQGTVSARVLWASPLSAISEYTVQLKVVPLGE